jgi:hypothetical protein
LAFIAYWGIVLFGYDTCVGFPCWLPRRHEPIEYFSISGVAGGIVQSEYFQIKFGVRPAEGPVKQSRIDNVSASVVSVLQGGAFFGALSSAPVSGASRVILTEAGEFPRTIMMTLLLPIFISYERF